MADADAPGAMQDSASGTAAAAAGPDPGVGLRSVAALRRLADQLEALQVASARAAGWSWEGIGLALGVTKQAVHKKYAHKLDAQDGQDGRHQREGRAGRGAAPDGRR